MAYTTIYPFDVRLDRHVDYAGNEDKTILGQRGVDYATNPEKTERDGVKLVSVLNCRSAETAIDEMIATKRRWNNKRGKNLGWCCIQSFKPGEVTPEVAHEIGVKFATQVFGDRFEVVIGTHLDRAHLHNHIVINSVSFVDGKKYHSNKGSYYKVVRARSDELCREYGLSIIDPKGKGKQYGEWKAERDGRPTVRGMIRTDMDAIMREAYTLDAFFALLEKKGYAVQRRNSHRKYTTVRPPGGRKAIRLASLGEAYTEEAITERLARQRHEGFAYPAPRQARPGKRPSRYRAKGIVAALVRPKITGFQALYLRYVYLLRKIRRSKRPYRTPFPIRQELAKLQRYQRQFQYLTENGITSTGSLEERIALLEYEIVTLAEERKPLYDQRRDAPDESTREQVSSEIERLTATIRGKRRELALCRRIQEDVPVVTERARQAGKETIEKHREEMQDERQRRDSRSGDTRELPDHRGID